MAYRVEPNNDIVISGFEKGIGDSPYTGLFDAKSVVLDSVPGEAPVNFSTQSVTQAASYSNLTATANGDGLTVTVTGMSGAQVEVGQAVLVSNSSISGLTNGTFVYVYVHNTPGQITFTSSYYNGSALAIGNTGTANLATIDPNRPKFFANSNLGATGSNFMLDANGRVWTDAQTTQGGGGTSPTNSWTYVGNTLASDSNGNGLSYWRTINSTAPGDWDGWLFVFRDGHIDYLNVNRVNNGSAGNFPSNNATFTYGWNPTTGTTGVTSPYLTGNPIAGCPHNATGANNVIAPDGNLYFCDYYTMGKIQQTDIVTPVNFSPTNNTTYIYTHAHNLPITEMATCISPLGNDFLIGGRFNQAYLWNGVDQLTITTTIPLAEPYVHNIVTVNTNAFLFVGNRGNIYLTNGAQANVYRKVPDHISNTISPYFAWGGATYQKGKLYFGVYAMDNAQNAIVGYGGVWAINLTTEAMYLAHQLSYGDYSGYPTAMFSVPPILDAGGGVPTDPAGSGLLIGWSATNFGIDKTISTPYTGGQAYVISDLIPIGTLLKPITPSQVEYKLSAPLLSGESVQLLITSALASGTNPTFTNLGTSSGDGSKVSDNFPTQLQNLQWIMIKAVLTAKSSSPSYNRLTEIRIIP